MLRVVTLATTQIEMKTMNIVICTNCKHKVSGYSAGDMVTGCEVGDVEHYPDEAPLKEGRAGVRTIFEMHPETCGAFTPRGNIHNPPGCTYIHYCPPEDGYRGGDAWCAYSSLQGGICPRAAGKVAP